VNYIKEKDIVSYGRKINARKHVKLSAPRIPPLDKKEARKINKALLKKFEWEKKVNLLIENPVTHALFALNVYATLMRNPDMTMGIMMSFRQLSSTLSLPERDRDILILRTAWLCYCDYVWGQHVLMGKNAGLSEEEINLIKEGAGPERWDPFNALLVRAVDEIYSDAFITDQTWKKLNEKYNEEQIMDLIFLVGQYNALAMFLNSFGVPLEHNRKGF
jgi:alkylhydroperoxidase family enzyme